jgi:hypothetical protein
LDYHVCYENHYYSVPYQYVKKEMTLRITQSSLQLSYKNKIIAVHVRAYSQGNSTVKEHMPKSHQEYVKWTPEALLKKAEEYGQSTQDLLQKIMELKVNRFQACRPCLGVLRLSKKYGKERLEKAASRALAIGSYTYQSIESILKKGLDHEILPEAAAPELEPIIHENIRGEDYFS